MNKGFFKNGYEQRALPLLVGCCCNSHLLVAQGRGGGELLQGSGFHEVAVAPLLLEQLGEVVLAVEYPVQSGI